MSKAPVAVAAACIMLLSACGEMPQTRAEFTNHPKIVKETYTVARSLDAVVTSLDKQANACINGMTGQTSVGGGGAVRTSRDAYLMTIDKTAGGRAELTYRQASNDMIGQPKGGFYSFAADLQANGPRSTQVTLYHGALLQDKLTNAVKEWSKGNDGSCHGYKMVGS